MTRQALTHWLAARHAVLSVPGGVLLGLHQIAHGVRMLTPLSWHAYIPAAPDSLAYAGLLLLACGLLVRILPARQGDMT